MLVLKSAYNCYVHLNVFRYEYVAVFDYDEIFVPKIQPNWESMLDEIINVSGAHDTFQFRNTYFMDKMQEAHGYEPDVPEYLTIMKNVYRSVISTDMIKSIHKTDSILGKERSIKWHQLNKMSHSLVCHVCLVFCFCLHLY